MFTKETAAAYGRKGGLNRSENLTAYDRQQRARKAAYKRWYKIGDTDEMRVDRHLKMVSGIVGMALAQEDYNLALKAISLMIPFEKMKIALNRGLIDATPQPPAPSPQLEDQEQIEARLIESLKRRQAKMMEPISEAEVVEPSKPSP